MHRVGIKRTFQTEGTKEKCRSIKYQGFGYGEQFSIIGIEGNGRSASGEGTIREVL